MSFNRKTYDEKCYTDRVGRNSHINDYMLNPAANNCKDCFQSNPEIRNQKKQALTDINVENDLFGIDRKDSCADYNNCDETGCKTQKFDTVPDTQTLEECNFPTSHSRLDRTVKDLKEATINRWAWLPIDPQKHVVSDISSLSSRNHIKDNYKEQLDVPEDFNNELEYSTTKNIKYTSKTPITPY